MYPGAVRNHIHAIDGKNHATAKTKPGKNGLSRRLTAPEPYIAIPTKASGHQPQGGIDAATRRPESIATKAWRVTFEVLLAQHNEMLSFLWDDR
jgi:hypothetical protein